MNTVRLAFYLSALFVVEATINICIPLKLPSQLAESPDDIFKGIAKDIRQQLTSGEQPDLVAPHVDVNITHPAIDLLGTLDNVTFYNFHHFGICFLNNIFVNSSYYKFDVFNLTFPNLRIEGLYNLTGDLGDIFDIYGDGEFWLEARNISVAMVDFHINVTDQICIPINLEIDLQEVGNNFDNFMYDDELEQLFNEVISSILPDAIQILWAEWKEMFDPLFEDQINGLFHKHKLASIFKRLLTNGHKRSSGEEKKWKYCFNSDDYIP